jgi:hypothetical protein
MLEPSAFNVRVTSRGISRGTLIVIRPVQTPAKSAANIDPHSSIRPNTVEETLKEPPSRIRRIETINHSNPIRHVSMTQSSNRFIVVVMWRYRKLAVQKSWRVHLSHSALIRRC